MTNHVQNSRASGQVFTTDALLQRVIETALSDTEISAPAAMGILSKIMNYERRDLEWIMDFISNGNQALGDYLDYTICYLGREQFARFVQRVENYYTELLTLPGMGVHEAWELLIGYHEGDPGTTPEETRAVLLVNAAVRDTLLSYRFFPLESVRNVIVNSRYASDHGGEYTWGVMELDPEMISYVTSRVADLDIIIHLIRTEYLWHPDYLTLRLGGELDSSPFDDEMSILRKRLITRIANTPGIPAAASRDARSRVEEAFDTGNIDALRVYDQHCHELTASTSTMDKVISSLRLAGHNELAPVIRQAHFDACRTVDEAISNEPSMLFDGATRVNVRKLVLNNIGNLGSIVGDLHPVVEVIKNRGVTDWDNISDVREELNSVAPSLREGVL